MIKCFCIAKFIKIQSNFKACARKSNKVKKPSYNLFSSEDCLFYLTKDSIVFKGEIYAAVVFHRILNETPAHILQ